MAEHARVLPPRRQKKKREPHHEASSESPETPDRPAKTVSAKKSRSRKRSARGHGQRLTLEDYQLLVEGYRRHPGDHAKAAKLGRVTPATARRTWFYGLGAAYEFGQRPLKDVIAEEQTLARAEMQRRIQAETEAAYDRARRAKDPTGLARRDLPASTAEVARRDAITARAAEAALVRATRANTVALTGAVGRVVRGMVAQAKMLEKQLCAEALPVKDGILAMKRGAEIVRTAAQAADLVIETERKLLGDSDGVPDEATMSTDEAAATIRSANDALERAEAMGLTVYEGGKSYHKPGQLPSWNDAPGGAGSAEGEPAVPDYDVLPEGEELGEPDTLSFATDAAAELPADSDEAW